MEKASLSIMPRERTVKEKVHLITFTFDYIFGSGDGILTYRGFVC